MEERQELNEQSSSKWIWAAVGVALALGVAAYAWRKTGGAAGTYASETLDDLFGKCENLATDLESRLQNSQLAS